MLNLFDVRHLNKTFISVKAFTGDDSFPSQPKRRKFLEREMQLVQREMRELEFRDWVKEELYLDIPF
jgi:hypothetical protein